MLYIFNPSLLKPRMEVLGVLAYTPTMDIVLVLDGSLRSSGKLVFNTLHTTRTIIFSIILRCLSHDM